MAQEQELQTKRQTVRVGLLGQDYGGKTYPDRDMNFFNCFPEIYRNPTTGEERHVLQRFPGLGVSQATNADLGAALVSAHGLTQTNLFTLAHIAMAQMNDVFIAAIVDTSSGTVYIMKYSISSSSIVEIGSIAKLGAISAANSCHDVICIEECQIANAGTIYPGITVTRTAFDKSLSQGWYSRATSATNFGAASLNQIVAAAYPDQLGTPLVTTGPIIQMNGIFHVLTTSGVIYSSNGGTGTPNDPTNWASTAVIQCYQEPDFGVALCRYKHHILAFGSNSVEFFNDEGIAAPASPLARTEQAFIKFGLNSPRCVLNVRDTIYWISYGKYASMGLYKLEGYTPVKVSTSKQDTLISSRRVGGNLNDISLFCLPTAGKTHIGINGILVYSDLYQTFGTTGYTNSLLGPNDAGYASEYSKRWNYTAGILAYNTDDKLWWNMCLYPGEEGTSVAGSTWGILPAYPTKNWSADVLYADFISILCVNNKYTSSGITTKRGSIPSKITGAGVASSSWSASVPWDATLPMMVQFNSLTFGSNKRKRINDVELVFAQPPKEFFNIGAPIHYITLAFNKTNQMHYGASLDGHYDQWVWRYLPVVSDRTSGLSGVSTTSPAGSLNVYNMMDRYYQANLGMARACTFAVVYSGYGTFDLEALEIDLELCES